MFLFLLFLRIISTKNLLQCTFTFRFFIFVTFGKIKSCEKYKEEETKIQNTYVQKETKGLLNLYDYYFQFMVSDGSATLEVYFSVSKIVICFFTLIPSWFPLMNVITWHFSVLFMAAAAAPTKQYLYITCGNYSLMANADGSVSYEVCSRVFTK